ncbi:MAG TPA: hypothetical protein VEQ63_02065, partial [Bryobacteraceae bacterium]|nr:hypothetical protein [Bryobacteraceae bacterium]
MKRNFATIAIVAALGGSAITYHATQQASAPAYVMAQDRAMPLTFAPMIRQVTPAVVNVTSEVRPQRNVQSRRRAPQNVPPGMEDWFRDFFGEGGGAPERRRGGG